MDEVPRGTCLGIRLRSISEVFWKPWWFERLGGNPAFWREVDPRSIRFEAIYGIFFCLRHAAFESKYTCRALSKYIGVFFFFFFLSPISVEALMPYAVALEPTRGIWPYFPIWCWCKLTPSTSTGGLFWWHTHAPCLRRVLISRLAVGEGNHCETLSLLKGMQKCWIAALCCTIFHPFDSQSGVTHQAP